MSFEDALHGRLADYMKWPQWSRSLVGTSYRMLPDRLKYGSAFDGYRTLADVPPGYASVASLEGRLSALIGHAVTTVPAYSSYRELAQDGRSALERLEDITPVDKPAIKAALPSFLSNARNESQRLPMFTGGSTAHPMRFFLERSTTRPRETAYARIIDRRYLGATGGDWVLSLRGRTVTTVGEQGGRFWMTEPIKRHLILSSDHLEERYMPMYCHVLRQLRPRLIHAFPSALYPLCRWLADHPLPEFTMGVRGILLTSENIYEFQMELFRKVFGCVIIRHYGHSERAAQGISLPNDDRYHFWPHYGIVELLDADGRVIREPGELGEIVATGFDNRVMPFVRYRTGDLGEWALPPRNGDRLQMVMRRVEGRLQEFVVCSDHRLVSVTTLGAAHFAELASVQAIQFEQQQPGAITLKVVASRRLSEAERASIAQAVRAKTQGGCEVSVLDVPAIERTARGKHRMLIQHLDLSRYFGASVTQLEQDRLVSCG